MRYNARQKRTISQRDKYIGYKDNNGRSLFVNKSDHTVWEIDPSNPTRLIQQKRGAGVVCDVQQGSTIVTSDGFFAGSGYYRDTSDIDPIKLGNGNDAEDAAAVDAATTLKKLESEGKITKDTQVTLYLQQRQGFPPCSNCQDVLKWLAWKYRGVKITIYKITIYWYDGSGNLLVRTFYRP